MTVAEDNPISVASRAQPHTPKVRRAVAVLVSRFPLISQTFIVREIEEMERQGQPVLLVPMYRQKSRVVHEEARRWIDDALFTPFFSRKVIGSNLRALARRPLRYLSILYRLIVSALTSPSMLIRNVAIFPQSVLLAEHLDGEGIRHVHALLAHHPATTALVISALSDITFSFTAHGWDIFVHRSLLEEKVRKASFIRAASTFNEAFLTGLYPGAEEKIEVIHLGIDSSVYDRSAAVIDESDRFDILSVASLEPHKGISFLVEACALLKERGTPFRCRVIGDGSRTWAIESLIRARGLEGEVTLLGELPQREVARQMAHASIFVFPSVIGIDGLMDGVPVALMEAMASRKPVVASAISGIPELVDHDVSGFLVDAGNPDQLADAIDRLIDDPELRDSMGRAGARRIRTEFQLQTTIARFVSTIERFNPTPAEVRRRIARIVPPSIDAAGIGIRKMLSRRDSTVFEVLVAGQDTVREMVIKQQKTRSGESRPASDRARHERDVLLRLRAIFDRNEPAAGSPLFSVPRVLAFDESNATIVMERTSGRPLDELIRERRTRRGGTGQLAGEIRSAGQWLRLLQEHTTSDGDGRDLVDQIAFRAHRDLDLATAAESSLRSRKRELMLTLRALQQRVRSSRIRLVGHHGDFWPGNLHVSDTLIEVIDFEGFREGLPEEDLAWFLIQLRLFYSWPSLYPRYLPLERAFLEGANGNDQGGRTDAFAFCCLAKALRILAGGAGERGGAAAASRWRRRTLRSIILGALR